MKNKEIVAKLHGFTKIDKLKLGAVILKTILKNKKSLMVAFEELEEVRKGLISDYKKDGSTVEAPEFSEENLAIVNKEWLELSEKESDVVISTINSGHLDQFSDITLEQLEVLESMAE